MKIRVCYELTYRLVYKKTHNFWRNCEKEKHTEKVQIKREIYWKNKKIMRKLEKRMLLNLPVRKAIQIKNIVSYLRHVLTIHYI